MNKWVLVAIAVGMGAILGTLNGCAYPVDSAQSAIEYLDAAPRYETPEAAEEHLETVLTLTELAASQQVGRIEASKARREAVNAFGGAVLGPILDQIGQFFGDVPIAGPAVGAALLGLPTLLAAFGVKRPGDVTRSELTSGFLSRSDHEAAVAREKQASYNKGLADGMLARSVGGKA